MTLRAMKIRLLKVLVPGASLLLLGSCPLTDQQITSIGQSAVSTSVNTILAQLFTALFSSGATTP